MALGNYKETPVYWNGIQVGCEVTYEDFDIGKHCEGMSADGETVSSMWLKGKRHDNPNNISVDITHLAHSGIFLISTHGGATLDSWEKLLSDLLDHIRSLK